MTVKLGKTCFSVGDKKEGRCMAFYPVQNTWNQETCTKLLVSTFIRNDISGMCFPVY